MSESVHDAIPALSVFGFEKNNSHRCLCILRRFLKRHNEQFTVDTFQEKSGMEEKLPFYNVPFS